jgi:hypothetical protein
VTYFAEAWLEGLDVSRTSVRLGDLSSEGVFVDARTVLPPGTIARLRFRLEEREIGVMTEVRYSIPAIGMGLHFLDLAPDDRAAIQAFVAAC